MRASIAFAIGLAASVPCFAGENDHLYTKQERYAGCLFGEIVPMLRKGYERNRALSIASWKCESLSVGFTERQIQDISDYVNYSIDTLNP